MHAAALASLRSELQPALRRRAFPAWAHLAAGVALPAPVAVPRVRDALVLRPVFVRSAHGRRYSDASGGR